MDNRRNETETENRPLSYLKFNIKPQYCNRFYIREKIRKVDLVYFLIINM